MPMPPPPEFGPSRLFREAKANNLIQGVMSRWDRILAAAPIGETLKVNLDPKAYSEIAITPQEHAGRVFYHVQPLGEIQIFRFTSVRENPDAPCCNWLEFSTPELLPPGTCLRWASGGRGSESVLPLHLRDLDADSGAQPGSNFISGILRAKNLVRREATLAHGRFHALSSHNGGRGSFSDDAAIVLSQDNATLLLSLDGMGGNGGADLGVEIFAHAVCCAVRGGAQLADALDTCAVAMEEEYLWQTKRELYQAGLVATGVRITGSHAEFCGIGDTRAMLLRLDADRNYQIVHETEEMTTAARLLQAGEISVAEFKDHRLRHEVPNRLGMRFGKADISSGARVQNSGSVSLQAHDIILLGSDGLFAPLTPFKDFLIECPRSNFEEGKIIAPKQIADYFLARLRDQIANHGGKKDHVNIIAYQHLPEGL